MMREEFDDVFRQMPISWQRRTEIEVNVLWERLRFIDQADFEAAVREIVADKEDARRPSIGTLIRVALEMARSGTHGTAKLSTWEPAASREAHAVTFAYCREMMLARSAAARIAALNRYLEDCDRIGFALSDETITALHRQRARWIEQRAAETAQAIATKSSSPQVGDEDDVPF